MGGRKKQTVGHRYFFGIHMGVSRGPIDELVEIKVGDRTAWTGSVTTSATVQIDAPELFGGDDKEGGIVGPLDVMMGKPDQAVNPRLAGILGGLVPAFRGAMTLFFDGLMCSGSPYPKPWRLRCRRALKGWDGEPWYPERAIITMAGPGGAVIKAMNPAHMLYECFTNADWGRGLERARLDDAQWRAAADKLFAEGFGLCLAWLRQDALSSFTQGVLDHVGGVHFSDPATGLVVLRLIRDDFTAGDLPLFDADSGLLAIEDDDAASQADAVNEMVVRFRSPTDGKDRQVRVKNPAAIHGLNGVSSTTKDYLGIPTAELALRVALRDLRAQAGFIKKFKVRLDRRGADVLPGGVFRIRDLQRGIGIMVLRAGRVEHGPLDDGAITVTAAQDVFGLPLTSYVDVQASGWVAPQTTPVPVFDQRAIELPYRDLVATGTDVPPADAGFLGVVALAPAPLALGFALLTKPALGSAYSVIDSGSFCPGGRLAAPVGPAATALALTSTASLVGVRAGSAALLGDECVRVDAVDEAMLTLTVARGCADTVPAAHLAGTVLYCYEDSGAADPSEYLLGASLLAKLLTRTGAGVLAEASAGAAALVIAGRTARPYPPARLQIDGQSYPGNVTAQPLLITWAHRNRLTQADQLVPAAAGDIAPEAGVTYGVRVTNAGTGAVIRESTGLDSPVLSVGMPVGAYNARVQVWSRRDGLQSWQSVDHSFAYSAAAPAVLPGALLGFTQVTGGLLVCQIVETDPARRARYYLVAPDGTVTTPAWGLLNVWMFWWGRPAQLSFTLGSRRMHTYLTTFDADPQGLACTEVPLDLSSQPSVTAGELRPVVGTQSLRPELMAGDNLGGIIAICYQSVFRSTVWPPVWQSLGLIQPAETETWGGQGSFNFFPAINGSPFRRLMRTDSGWVLMLQHVLLRTTDLTARTGWRRCYPLAQWDYAASIFPTVRLSAGLVVGDSIYVAGIGFSRPSYSALAVSRDAGATWTVQELTLNGVPAVQICSLGTQVLAIFPSGAQVAINDGVTSGWTLSSSTGLALVADVVEHAAVGIGSAAYVLDHPGVTSLTVNAGIVRLMRSTDGTTWTPVLPLP